MITCSGYRISYYVDGLLVAEGTTQDPNLPENSSHKHGAGHGQLWLGSIPWNNGAGKGFYGGAEQFVMVIGKDGEEKQHKIRGSGTVGPGPGQHWYDAFSPGLEPFKGWIAEPIVYEHVLDPTRVAQHYYAVVGEPFIWYIPQVAGQADRVRTVLSPELIGDFRPFSSTKNEPGRRTRHCYAPTIKIQAQSYYAPVVVRNRAAKKPSIIANRYYMAPPPVGRRRIVPKVTGGAIGDPGAIELQIDTHEMEVEITTARQGVSK